MSILFVLAQAAAVAAPPPASAPAEQGVTSYPPAFFAAQQPANAWEMVDRLPGFRLDTGSSVRGYEDAAGNVLIDGQRPATKTDALDEILRRIPASEVARIDLIRGGAPGIDMQGKSVVANIIRKDGSGIHGVAAVAVNRMADDGRTAPQIRLEANGGRAGRAWEGSLRAFSYVDDGIGDGALRRSDGSGHQLLAADLDSKAGGKQEIAAGAIETPLFGGGLRINGRLFWDAYTFTETDDVSLPSRFLQHDDYQQHKFNTEVGARYSRGFGPNDRLEAVALRQTQRLRYSERFAAPGETTRFFLANDTAESIVRAVLKHSHSERLSWEAGAEGAFNELDAVTDLTENGRATLLPAANVHVEEKRGEALAKLTWRPVAPLTLEADLAEEGSTITATGDVRLSKSLYFTKPRVALTWVVDPETQVRVRYERVVGQLNFNDFVASSSLSTGVLTAGNPNLNPEQDWVSEIAFERRFLGSGSVIVTYRRSKITDAADRAPIFTPAGVFDQPANIGSGLKEEYAAEATIPLDRIGLKRAQLRGQATWRHSEVTDPTTGAKREISGLHPVDWDAHFSQDIPAWRLTWGVDVFGGWRESYYRFDVVEDRKQQTFVAPFVEWKPRPGSSIRVELDNATERGYRDTITQYAGPRSTAPVTFVQDRRTHVGRELFIRLRRTFG